MTNEKLKSLLESTDGLTEEFKAAVAPIVSEAIEVAVKAKEEELKGLYEEKLAAKDKELAEKEESYQSDLNELNESIEQMVSLGVEEQMDAVNKKINTYLEYVVEEFVKEHESDLIKLESMKISESFMKDIGSLYEKYNIEKPESSKALEEELSKTKSELSESYNTIYDLVTTRDELESKVEDFERANVIRMVSEEMNLSSADSAKIESLIEGFGGTQEEFKSKVVDLAESLSVEKKETSQTITEGTVVTETTPITEDHEVKTASQNYEVDAIAESLKRYNRK